MIKVQVQTKDRLAAINNLCKAILNCSEALKANVTVNISDCDIKATGTASVSIQWMR